MEIPGKYLKIMTKTRNAEYPRIVSKDMMVLTREERLYRWKQEMILCFEA